MMKRFLSVIFLVITGFSALAQDGYEIKISLKPYKNQYLYLGYHYGKMKALADSVLLDASSTGTFKGNTKLPGGIYFVVSPNKEILFEVLIDRSQHFSIEGDTAAMPQNIRFTGTEENSRFQAYSRFAAKSGQEISAINARIKEKGNDPALAARSRQLTDGLKTYRDSISAKDPDSFLAALFQAMREPEIPPASAHPGGKYDSLYAYQYFKSHYWDGISFSDDRLVRTPFFEPKLEKYYKELVVPHPDTLKLEIDRMLLESRSAPEMYKFLMVHFVQKYINPQYMGQDAVFVHLFEKYINAGLTPFFTDKYREFVDRRAYSLMANLIGKPAANMEMVDTLGKPVTLYGTKGDFTVLVFWDPTCGHCKEVVPKLDSIYKAKWKNQNIQLFAVKTEGPDAEWRSFIRENKLNNWLHVTQLPAKQEAETKAGKPGYRQLYDVYQTPVLYLLDKDKRILAKKLTYLQIDEVIDQKIKNLN